MTCLCGVFAVLHISMCTVREYDIRATINVIECVFTFLHLFARWARCAFVSTKIHFGCAANKMLSQIGSGKLLEHFITVKSYFIHFYGESVAVAVIMEIKMRR